MINILKPVLKKLLPARLFSRLAEIKNHLLDGYASKSYSQEGEDMILRRMFENQQTGFYVDVGAHHPHRFSNTYYFYKLGWRGINIDAMPGSMAPFKKYRPRDINIEKPVADKKQTLTFFAFDEPALNGFSEKQAALYASKNYRIIFQKELETSTLEEILDASLPPNQQIDFLSIDVEGLDMMVLKSNNWVKYAPQVVLVEILGFSITQLASSEVANFMHDHGYEFFAKSVNTAFFKKIQSC